MMVSANFISPFLVLLILASFLTSMLSSEIPCKTQDCFLDCLSHSCPNCYSFILTPQNSSYSSFIQLYTFNHRFNNLNTTAIILTPNQVSQIQSTVTCATKHGMHIRIRSGGHDLEGLSFRSLVDLPYAILDLSNLRKVNVSVQEKVAWVEAGATLGELYYGIARTETLGFPAGTCPTVGVGGHFSGGGEGMMMRKHGLAADHIVDAHLVDVEGRVLDRASMGEDLFWAIRGGGGNTFGVVVSWKIKLVPVPPVVTVFNVVRTLEQNATDIVHQWQEAVSKFEEDLVMKIFINREENITTNSSNQGARRIQAAFTALFLGGADRLVSSVENTFSELGLVRKDCIEMNWIRSIMYHAGYQQDEPLNVLLKRDYKRSRFFPGHASGKIKSDYVTKPISNNGLEGIWERVGGNTEFPQTSQVQFTSYGGRMDKISESSIPFPHRAGILYEAHYTVVWADQDCGAEVSRKHMDWIRELYNYMTPLVSKNPRAVYANNRDLDLGNNSYEQAQEWGFKYFKGNFQRLVNVKTAVDPANFFRNEQSIPPHRSSSSLLTHDS